LLVKTVWCFYALAIHRNHYKGTTMNRIILTLLSTCFVAQLALAQDIVVGTVSIDMVDKSRSRPFTVELWFEAADGVKASNFSVLPPLQPILIAQNTAPKASPQAKPLIVISHGNWSTRYGHGDMAIELVKAGYIVMTTSHPGTMNGDLQTSYRLRLWERSRDVTSALSQLLADPAWAARIDTQRIGFVGHSFGAWTGLSLAGGRYDFARQLAACNTMATPDQYCTGMVKDYTAELPTQDSTFDYSDKRIKAFYLMAGGPGAGFTPESLAAVKSPMVFDTAKFDVVLAPGMGSSLMAKSVPGAKEIMRDVGHFTYAPVCRPIIGRALAGQICVDPDGVDRVQVHADVAKDAKAFFASQL
jgi:predicted dienelactone hydrolase